MARLGKKKELLSSTVTPVLCLVVGCSVVFALTAFAADPSWWSTPGPDSRSAVEQPQVVTNDGVVTTNYVRNDNLVVTQGQLKQFTARAVSELNANLSGGAGTNLNTMVSNWAADYATNGYNLTNIKPSDYTAMNVGQLKYIGSNVWTQLVAGGYTNALPAWLAPTNTDYQLANLGQLKQVFDFDFSALSSPTNSTLILGGTSATLSWSDSGSGVLGYIIEYSTNSGTSWSNWTTVSGTSTSATLTGLALDANYEFQIIATNATSSSAPSSPVSVPFITLATPETASLVP